MTNYKQKQAALERVNEAKRWHEEMFADSCYNSDNEEVYNAIQAALDLAREKLALVEGLRPCPFCGSEAKKNTISYDYGEEIYNDSKYDTDAYSVECKACYAETVHLETLEEATKFWNTRTSPALEKLITERS